MRRLSEDAKARRRHRYYVKKLKWKSTLDRISRYQEYEARVRDSLMLLAHVACDNI